MYTACSHSCTGQTQDIGYKEDLRRIWHCTLSSMADVWRWQQWICHWWGWLSWPACTIWWSWMMSWWWLHQKAAAAFLHVAKNTPILSNSHLSAVQCYEMYIISNTIECNWILMSVTLILMTVFFCNNLSGSQPFFNQFFSNNDSKISTAG